MAKKKKRESTATMVRFTSDKGIDGAYIYPPSITYAPNGERTGSDAGVYVSMLGAGVTREYNMDNPEDVSHVERIRDAIDRNLPIIRDLGLREVEPEAPLPPFAKWDIVSASTIRVMVETLLGDDHDSNIKYLNDALVYENANQKRKPIIDILEGMISISNGEQPAIVDTVEV